MKRYLNKRDYDGSVKGLPQRTTVITVKKPVKSKDNQAFFWRTNVGSAATNYSVNDTSTSACEFAFKPAFGITRGTSNGQRIGHEIRLRNLYMHIECIWEETGVQDTSEAAWGSSRLLVFLDTQNNKVDYPVSASLWDDQGLLTGNYVHSNRSLDTRKRFKVLLDKQLDEAVRQYSTAENGLFYSKKFNIPINEKVFYDETDGQDTTGQYDTMIKNALYVYIVTPVDSVDTEWFRRFRIVSRVTYQDT